MSTTLDATDIEKLTIDERLDLIARLWDSLPDTSDGLPMPQWHKDILDQRIQEADANPQSGIPWEIVRAELRSGA